MIKTYHEWLLKCAHRGPMGRILEPLEANPDGVVVEPHEVTVAEEVIRRLLDHPVERVELFGPFGSSVFDALFLDGLTMRQAARKFGKASSTSIHREVERIRRKLRGLISEKGANEM